MMPDHSKKNPWLALMIFFVICFGVAALGGLATAPNISTWYTTLQKPDWTPPGWIFAPAWTFLYACMAVAAWLVWRRGRATLPMTLFGVQLAFNAAWSWIFFHFHCPGLALVDVFLLWLAIVATTLVFWRKSIVAGAIFVPYLAWVTFAAALNCAFWRLN